MWHGLFLGNGVDAFAPTMRIQEAFMAAFMAAGGPIEMALFSKSEVTDAHEVTLYFSPAAASFAKTIQGAAPCERPLREHLGLLPGDQRCWTLLFPDS